MDGLVGLGYPEAPDVPDCPEVPGYPDYPGVPVLPVLPVLPEFPEFPVVPGWFMLLSSARTLLSVLRLVLSRRGMFLRIR